MDIRINKLTLHNFKGIRDMEFAFEGRNARIDGENGAGKSTVFDAFIWLLFGKDHRGLDWTNFDLKPIDPATGEAFHNLEHWVEAQLTIDGSSKTLRRLVVEEWIKPRGEAEKVFKGHKQSFFIDGVDTATKKAYDAAVSQWIDEGVFKMITNPHYFIDDQYTDWKARRKAILELAGPVPTLAEFADLVAEMHGEPLEQFRKRIAAEKKANKDRLAEASANIAAWRKALPDVSPDTTDLEARLNDLYTERDKALDAVRDKIRTIDEGIADINVANADRIKQTDALNRELSKVRLAKESIINDAINAAMQAGREAASKAADARMQADRLTAEAEALERSIQAAEGDIKTALTFRTNDAKQLAALGEQYQAEKERLFKYDGSDTCPTCGQPLPKEQVQASIEEARQKFIQGRQEALSLIVDRANRIKAAIASYDESIAARKAKQQTDVLTLAHTRKELEQVKAQAEPASTPDAYAAEQEARKTEAFTHLVDRERQLQQDIIRITGENVSIQDLLSDRRRMESDITTLRDGYELKSRTYTDQIAVATERRKLDAMIEEEIGRQKAFADEVARLERLEFRTTEYMKAQVDAQEGAINSLFRVARWKMFAPTIDGGLTEMCEVTTEAGVPYRSMNDAAKILCGLDVIRVFSERHDVTAPIFIDNAEGITRRSFDTRAQVIRLCVKEGSELTMIHE